MPTPPPVARWAPWARLMAYAGLLFALSSLPSVPLEPAWPQGDKLLHLLAYIPLGWLAHGAFAGLRQLGRRPWRLRLAALGAAALYAASDEWHQALVPGRTADLADWAADLLGIGAGIALAARLRPATGAVSPIDNPR